MNDVVKDAEPAGTGDPAVARGERTVTYTFPVKVVVVGALTKEDFEAIERRIWSDINTVLSGSG